MVNLKKQPTRVEIIRLSQNVDLPEQAYMHDAGLDLQLDIASPITVYPGESLIWGTGLKIHINDQSIVGIVAPRSGLGSKGLIIGNGIGVIDSGYQDEWKLCLWNRTENTIFNIEPKQRVAQVMFLKLASIYFQEVIEFTSTSNRGSGFGSSG